MAFTPGMQTAAVQAATMAEKARQPTFAQKAGLVGDLGQAVLAAYGSYSEAKRLKRGSEEDQRRQEEAMRTGLSPGTDVRTGLSPGTDVAVLAANMPARQIA